MRHVSWPTRAQVTAYTAVVVVISIATAVVLGVLDFGFSRALEFLLTR